MELIHYGAIALAGLIGLVVIAYLVVRAGSLGYYRTRDEYDAKRRWRNRQPTPPNKENTNGL